MACRVSKDKKGKISVVAENGKKSKLYYSALKLSKGNEELALKFWNTAQTDEFNNSVFNNNFDDNGEVNIYNVTNYLFAKEKAKSKLTQQQKDDVKNLLYTSDTKDVRKAFESLFDNGIFVIDKNRLEQTGLFTQNDIEAIMRNKETQDKLRKTAISVIASDYNFESDKIDDKYIRLSDEKLNELGLQKRETIIDEVVEKVAVDKSAIDDYDLLDELQQIKKDAIANGTFMKAPNGQPTNLTEKQWLTVRTKNFLAWFGDWINNPENASKVVDENGEPLVVYHGTRNVKATSFIGKGFFKDRLFLSSNRKYAKAYGKKVISSFLNIKNIYDIEKELKNNGYSNKEILPLLTEITNYEYLKKDAEELGYDGVYEKDGHSNFGYDEWVIFNPNQIKSATDNKGTFSKENDDIRYQKQNGKLIEKANVIKSVVENLQKTGLAKDVVFLDDVGMNKKVAEIKGSEVKDVGVKGFVYDNVVYLNIDRYSLDTPIHEFSHLFLDYVKDNNYEIYAKGIELIQKEGQAYIDKVSKLQPNLKGYQLYEEALAEMIGDKGAMLIEKSGLKEWLKEFWQSIKEFLGISDVDDISSLTLEQFTEKVSTDLLKGTNKAEFTQPYSISVLFDEMLVKKRGRFVSVQTIKQVLKQKGTKEIEKKIIEETLEMPLFKGKKKINFNEFVSEVNKKIMPLQVIVSDTYDNYGIDNVGVSEDAKTETHIYNSHLEHGDKGHFNADFPEKKPLINKDNIEYKIIQDEDKSPIKDKIYVEVYTKTGDFKDTFFIDKTKDIKEQLIEKINNQLNDKTIQLEIKPLQDKFAVVRGDVELTEDNIQENIYTVTNTREQAEQFIKNYVKKENVNRGMFGHTRVWYDNDRAYVAELQSDSYQKNKAQQMLLDSYKNDRDLMTDEQKKIFDEIENNDKKYNELEYKDFFENIKGELKHFQKEINYYNKNERIQNKYESYINNYKLLGKDFKFNDLEYYVAPNGTKVYSLPKVKGSLEERIKYEKSVYVLDFYGKDKYEFSTGEEAVNFWKEKVNYKQYTTKEFKEKLDFVLDYEKNKQKLEQQLLEKASLKDKQFLAHRKNYVVRLLREEIRDNAKKGYKKLLIPTPRTLALIEGYIQDESGEIPYKILKGDEDYLVAGDEIEYLGENYIVINSDYEDIVIVREYDLNIINGEEFKEEQANNYAEDLVYELEQLIDDENVSQEEWEELIENGKLDDSITSLDYDEISENGEIDIELIKEKVAEYVLEHYYSNAFQLLEDYGYFVYDLGDDKYGYSTYKPISETLKQPDRYEEVDKSDFDIDEMSESEQTVLRKYEELNELLKKERDDVEVVKDNNGNEWLATNLKETDATKPTIAFQVERLLPAEEKGRKDSGDINVEITKFIKDKNLIGEQQEIEVEKYAKKKGYWIKDKDFGERINNTTTEARVYHKKSDDKVTKVITLNMHENLQEYLDRVALRNYLFPNTKERIIGFTRTKANANTGEESQFAVVIEQPFIENYIEATVEEIDDKMRELGFKKVGHGEYINDNYIVSDATPQNVVIDNGKLRFIDPIVYLNTEAEGYGGTREFYTNFENIYNIPVKNAEGQDITTTDIHEQVLIVEKDKELLNSIKFVLNLSDYTWVEDRATVSDYVKALELEIAEKGIDIVGLHRESKKTIKDKLGNIYNVLNEYKQEDINKLFGDSKVEVTLSIPPTFAKFSKNISFVKDADEYEMFEKNKMVKIGKDIYIKVNDNRSVDELKELVGDETAITRQLDNIILPDTINRETAEKLALIKELLGVKIETKRDIDKIKIKNRYYLEHDFIKELYQTKLKEQIKDSELYNKVLKYFDLTINGMELNILDSIILDSINDYLYHSDWSKKNDLINYTILNYYSIDLNNGQAIVSDEITDEDYYEYYKKNPLEVTEYKGKFTKDKDVVIIRNYTDEKFIRIDNEVYMKVGLAGDNVVYKKGYKKVDLNKYANIIDEKKKVVTYKKLNYKKGDDEISCI